MAITRTNEDVYYQNYLLGVNTVPLLTPNTPKKVFSVLFSNFF